MVKISKNSTLPEIGEAVQGSWGRSESSDGKFVSLGSVVIATSTSLTFPFSVSGWQRIGDGLWLGWIGSRNS